MFNANNYYMGFSSIEGTSLGKTKIYLVSYYIYNGRFLYFLQNEPNNDKEIALANDDKEKFLKKYRKRSVPQLKKAYSCKHKETHLFLEKEFHSSYAELHYHYCDECGSVDIRKVIHDKEKHEAVIKLKFANGSLNETEQEIKKLKEKIEKLEKEKICHKQDIEKLEKILQ